VPVSWDLATEVMADISKYILAKRRACLGIKMYSYQYFENTYAITKLGMTSRRYAGHRAARQERQHQRRHRPGRRRHRLLRGQLPGLGRRRGVLPVGRRSVRDQDHAVHQWMMPGDKRFIFVTPHKTMGVAWGCARSAACGCPSFPGTDTVLHMALARIVIENNWQDQAFIDQWIANTWEVDSGYGRGTRNTGWQWRTTWGTWQSDWNGLQEVHPRAGGVQARRGGQDHRPERRRHQLAAEWIAKPKANGERPRTSFMLEKGNYWSNNYMNTTSLAALGLICGAGNRPGRMISPRRRPSARHGECRRRLGLAQSGEVSGPAQEKPSTSTAG
jgi:arsenite oxidase large subunit